MLAQHPASTPLDRLSDQIDALAAEDLARHPSTVVGHDLLALRRHLERLEAEFSRRLSHFDRTQGASSFGHLSTASWLWSKCHMRSSTAAEKIRVARGLDVLPQTAEAFAAGDISLAHAAVITRTIDEVGLQIARDAQPALLEAASRLDPGGLRQVTRHLRFCVDQGGSLKDSKQEFERRGLHLSRTMDGVYYLDGRLDPEGGEILRTALDALLGPPHRDEDRRPSQRRADALVELARRQLNGGRLPERGGQKPHLELSATLATLRRIPGSPPALLNGREPIPHETAQRLVCDATVHPVLAAADGTPLEVGRARRTISPSLRRALVRRDGGCRYPGCDRPAAWTDGHHITHWADGGETKLSNLVCLCRRHHRQVHEGGLVISLARDGQVSIHPP